MSLLGFGLAAARALARITTVHPFAGPAWADLEGRSLTADEWRRVPSLDQLGPDVRRVAVVDGDPRNPDAPRVARLHRGGR